LKIKANRNYIILIEVIFALAGIGLFSAFIHKELFFKIIAFSGLIITAICINHSISKLYSLPGIFGIYPVSKKTFYYLIVGLVFGCLLGMLYRYTKNYNLFPGSLHKFVIIAPLIGIMEELIFRGYIQGRIRYLGPVFSVIIASLSHTGYKFLIIKTLPLDIGVDFLLLTLLTFVVGIILGILKELSGNVIPSSLAHACFDIIVYGAYSTAPVWVWF